jgi:hypothetical protein
MKKEIVLLNKLMEDNFKPASQTMIKCTSDNDIIEKQNHLKSIVNGSEDYVKPQFSYWEIDNCVIRIEPDILIRSEDKISIIYLHFNFQGESLIRHSAKLALRIIQIAMQSDYPNCEVGILEVGKHIFHYLEADDDLSALDNELFNLLTPIVRQVNRFSETQSKVVPYKFGTIHSN